MRYCWYAVVGVLLLSGCATNTVTGRTQLQITSDDSVIKESKTWYRSMMSEYYAKGQLEKKPDLLRRTVDIANRLVDQAVVLRPDSAEWDWDVEVISSKELNAFCMAGGKMAVYSGLIEELELTDDELAAVIGHEIAHAIVGHSAERMSVATASNLAVLVASYTLGKDSRSRDLIYSVGSVATLALINLPHSRSGETEADEIGLRLAALAGFNPHAGRSVWQKMDKAGASNSRPEFLSTHPSSQSRQDNLAGMAQALVSEYEYGLKNRVKVPNPWIRKEFNKHVHFDREDYVRRIGTAEQPAVLAHKPGPTIIAAKQSSAPPLVKIAAFKVSPAYRFKSHSLMFDIGREELSCRENCSAMLKEKLPQIETYERNKDWRRLASAVLGTNYKSDLNYYRLARAAQGLGNQFAAIAYYGKAAELSRSEQYACRADPLYSCQGKNLPETIERDLQNIFAGTQ